MSLNVSGLDPHSQFDWLSFGCGTGNLLLFSGVGAILVMENDWFSSIMVLSFSSLA